MLTVVPVENCRDEQPSVKRVNNGRGPITFNNEDLEGMTQPHDDALVVMA